MSSVKRILPILLMLLNLAANAETLAADTLLADSLWQDPSGYVRRHGRIIEIGRGRDIRGCNAFSFSPMKLRQYAQLVNEYQDTFPNVQVYFLAIPTSIELYLPEAERAQAPSQRAAIDTLFAALSEKVKRADAYPTLWEHRLEPIYSRTDHHWQPLGAFYAAQQLASTMGVPFRSLSAYERRVVKGFVGTMYSFSGKDMAFKQAPENFVYYVPCQTEYKTTYVAYTLDKARRKVLSETEPYEDSFFRTYKDGSGLAYSTFMGGDTRLVRVDTDVKNGRRVLILKDSFGNALSSFLFYSFQQVHVVDCRYFTQNIIEYVRKWGITDIVFANNIAHTTPEAVESYRRYLLNPLPSP